MSRKNSVFFIGGGNMATAILGGLDRALWDAVVCEVNAEQRAKISTQFSVRTVAEANDPLIKEATVVLFSVKPQSVSDVLKALSSTDLSNKTVVSIMAGIPLQTLSQGLKGKNISFVRTMPNTPMLVGKGVTGVFCEEKSKALIQSLLGGSSQIFFIEDEDGLNKVTAISGSGPAYFFLFIEALRDAAVEMGFSREVATKMAIGTALGSAHLASTSEHDVSKLREMVTSKGGTTERALETFRARGLETTVRDAAFAALARGRELSKL